MSDSLKCGGDGFCRDLFGREESSPVFRVVRKTILCWRVYVLSLRILRIFSGKRSIRGAMVPERFLPVAFYSERDSRHIGSSVRPPCGEKE
ncbi:hypothetical protein, partial [Leptospirillum ferriphilum]|uniref:hypothetical protein n=1 Tax=Leptospirillum ferriphilum TaxID=178606 RepID=UPI00193A1F56